MVRIRLARMGAKKAPFYRVVVAEVTKPRNGRYIENLGYYDPLKDPQVVNLKEARVFHWLSQGAVPSETVHSLLRREGLLKQWSEMRKPSPAAGEAEEKAEDAPEA